MQAAIALALMTKAQKTFGRNTTMLSFPLAPIVFSKQQLEKVAVGDVSDPETLSEFSRLVGLIPSGRIWPPDEQNYLWNVYDDILDKAVLANADLSDADKAIQAQAIKQLYDIDADGRRQDSAAHISYKQYRDAWFVAQEASKKAEIEAHLSDDPELLMNWQRISEPKLRREIEALESEWSLKGHRQQIDQAKARLSSLNASSPNTAWAEWNTRFNPDLDGVTDIHGNHAMRASFTPVNAMDDASWQVFNLDAKEIKALRQQAPEELKSRLEDDQAGAKFQRLSFEHCSVGITRSWFDEQVLKSRFWHLADTTRVISDGHPEPSGECPYYVAGLVFVRNLEVTMTRSSSAASPRNGGARPLKIGFVDLTVKPAAAAHGKVTLRATRPSERPASRRGIAGAIKLKARSHRQRPKVRDNRRPRPIPPQRSKPRRALPKKLKKAIKTHHSTTKSNPNDVYMMALICKRVERCPNPDITLDWSR